MQKNIEKKAITSLVSIAEIYFEIAKLSGVSENHYWVLVALREETLQTQKEICQRWRLPKTTVNTLIKKMEAQGQVTLVPIPESRHELKIQLTALGQQYVNEVLALTDRIEKQLFQRAEAELSAHFFSDLIRYSEMMQETLTKYKEEYNE